MSHIPRLRRAAAVLAALACAWLSLAAAPAAFSQVPDAPAVPAGPLCEGRGSVTTPCDVPPYTTHDFQNHYATSYWGMPADQDTVPSTTIDANCTN